jgi:MoxR-like ATPase
MLSWTVCSDDLASPLPQKDILIIDERILVVYPGGPSPNLDWSHGETTIWSRGCIVMAESGARGAIDVGSAVKTVKAEIGKAVVGYEDQVDDFLTCLLTEGHILMEGVPGVAKTTLSKSFAAVCELSYRRIQFTQDLLPTDITGHYFYDQKAAQFEVRKGPIFADLLLADEINRAPPKTQSALLEAMQERQVTIEGTTFELPNPFMVIATLNPIETEGVYPLPEAQVDRFMIKSHMDYLDEKGESDILRMKSHLDQVLNPVVTRIAIELMKQDARRVYVHDSIFDYIRDIARATRAVDDLELGLSPRGAIHLLQVTQAQAYLHERSYVIPDDVKAAAHKVVDHRLILSPEAEMEGLTRAGITDSVLATVSVPKGDFDQRKKKKE